MIEKLTTLPPQMLMLIAVLAFVAAGAIKLINYLLERPVTQIEESKPILPKIKSETNVMHEKIKYQTDRNKVDFGFFQGVKFAFGFWFGTILFSVLFAIVFGGVIAGATRTFISHSVQDAFIRP